MCRLTPHILCVGGEDHHLRIPFLKALARRGFRVSAAGTCDPAAFLEAGIQYQEYRLSRSPDLLADRASLAELSSLFSDLCPTLIQCFDTKPDILVPLAARAAGVFPVVSTVTGLGWLYSSRSPLALSLRLPFLLAQRIAARFTAYTVFQNRDDQKFFVRHHLVRDGRHSVISGSGLDVACLDTAAANGPSKEAIRRVLGVGNAPLVITIARLSQEKGIRTLLEAAALVNQDAPQVRFLLVGPWEKGRRGITTAEIDRHAPYVRALGPRTDIPSLLRASDLFAFPTELREGVPRALMEACVAGVPAVTTGLPGCVDVIRHRWSGLVVPPRSPQLLASAILELLRDRDKASTYAFRASLHVRREMNLEIVTDQYASVYREVLAQAEPNAADCNGRPRGGAALATTTSETVLSSRG